MFIVRFWRRLPIFRKLGFTLGTLSLLIFIVAGLGDITLRSVIIRETRVIETNFKIERLVLEMVNHLQAAREAEFAFYLFYPEIGYEQAYDLYARTVLDELDSAITLSEELRTTIEGTVAQQAQESTINRFLTLAEQYKLAYSGILLRTEDLALSETGLVGRFDRARVTLGLYVENQSLLKDMYERVNESHQAFFRNKNQAHLQAAISEVDRLANTATLFLVTVAACSKGRWLLILSALHKVTGSWLCRLSSLKTVLIPKLTALTYKPAALSQPVNNFLVLLVNKPNKLKLKPNARSILQR